jgi:uncharacterized alkaline shock family protein YloU
VLSYLQTAPILPHNEPAAATKWQFEHAGMSTAETTGLGTVSVTQRAIATIACQAAMQSYGVVGMASPNLVSGLAHALAQDPTHGVVVHADKSHIVIEVYIIVEYGTRITTVAGSVANAVKYQVEKAMGMPVAAVDVHVQDLRVSDTD